MNIRKKRNAVVDQNSCVACGCCARVCPVSAISVYHGLFAQVDTNICVGCGKCANECPASVITIKEISNI